MSNKLSSQDLAPDLLTPNLVWFPPYLATSLHPKIMGSMRSTLTTVRDWRLRIKSVCQLGKATKPRTHFSWEQESSLSGLWLHKGSASCLLDVVPGKRGAGVEATRNVGKVVISMLSVIHPHGPWGPIFRLVCLPRKGQAQAAQKLEAHTLGLTNRNDEEMHAGSNQCLQHSGAGVCVCWGGGGLSQPA